MLPETMTFWSFLWMELSGISIIMAVFLLTTTVFGYWQLVELKLGGAIILLTIVVAVSASVLREVVWWRSLLYAFGGMYLAAGLWAIVFLVVNFTVDRVRARD